MRFFPPKLHNQLPSSLTASSWLVIGDLYTKGLSFSWYTALWVFLLPLCLNPASHWTPSRNDVKRSIQRRRNSKPSTTSSNHTPLMTQYPRPIWCNSLSSRIFNLRSTLRHGGIGRYDLTECMKKTYSKDHLLNDYPSPSTTVSAHTEIPEEL